MDREHSPTTATARAALDLPLTGILAVVGRFSDGPTDTPVALTSAAEVMERFGPSLPDGDAALALVSFFANGGERAYGVRVADGAVAPLAEALLGRAEAGTGLHALTGLPDPDLVCLPDTTRLDREEAAHLVTAAASLCAAQRRFLLVDPPAEVADGDGVIDWADRYGLRRRDAALYVPRVLVEDATNGGRRAIAPSAAVAGVYARTDRQRGVWKAPAGVEADLRGVVGLAVELGSREQDRLNPEGIDVLRRLPDGRIVVWGARTLAGDGSDPEWRYVPVRRTAVTIQRALLAGMAWTAAEPNEPQLWADIRADVEHLLDRLWREGAFAGATPRDAYVVRCGLGQTMTQADADRGVVILEVGIALVRPAEFVVLRLHLGAAPTAACPPPPGSGQPNDLGLSAGELAILQAVARRQLVIVGADGTGRGLVAQALADEAGASLYRIDLAAVVSRYIGETEKNLRRLFDRAEETRAILFFDEADALFGKRTEAAEADDRHGPDAATGEGVPRHGAKETRRKPDAEAALEAARRLISAYTGIVAFGVEDPETAKAAALPSVKVPPAAHGSTTATIDRILQGEEHEETPS
jgi:uncharacterized protein